MLRRTASLFVFVVAALAPARGEAQQIISTAETTVQVAVGQAVFMRLDQNPTRIDVADTTIATINFGVDQRQILVRGLKLGTTTMLVFDATGLPRLYKLEVVPDLTALQTQVRTVYPEVVVEFATAGNSIIVSGRVADPYIAARIIGLAAATGAPVINNLQLPAAAQVLLHVRFGELRKSALRRLGADLRFRNIHNIDETVGDGSTNTIETLSEGLVRIFLSGADADFNAIIQALRSTGDFRSLAEPNLVTLDGQEATFLAGGMFPYPAVQGGAQAGGIGIVFQEFGVRLKFTPVIQNTGAIRLKVEPEVSSLDFANGLVISGFQIPSILSRKTATNVELMPGQVLAIAGLLDNTMLESIDKIPFLGDLPIIGTFFRSKLNQQDRTELLVLVTPHLVEASNVMPRLPMGEPTQWRWDRNMQLLPDSLGRTMPQQRRGGTPR
jgi:pilus assembly protein CpaC